MTDAAIGEIGNHREIWAKVRDTEANIGINSLGIFFVDNSLKRYVQSVLLYIGRDCGYSFVFCHYINAGSVVSGLVGGRFGWDFCLFVNCSLDILPLVAL